MVPASVAVVGSLPFTPNGKLDRSALLARVPVADERVEPVEPVGEVEVALSGIWSDLLAGRRPGRHDNFFDVGGHSLLLMRMQHLIQERLGCDVPVVDLVNHPTISAQAGYLTTRRNDVTPEDAGRERADARLAARARRRAVMRNA
jgi:aryl carrier-like protein